MNIFWYDDSGRIETGLVNRIPTGRRLLIPHSAEQKCSHHLQIEMENTRIDRTRH